MKSVSHADSLWSLRFDVLWTRLLVWVVSMGREVELRPDTHLYLCDRYARLACEHDRRGRKAKARTLRAKAEEHYQASGGDGPPYAAAMAMPRPRQWITTDARSRPREESPLRLVRTQREHRVDAGGAAGGEIAGGERDHRQGERGESERERVGGRETEKL
jgi:hypothetical protein